MKRVVITGVVAAVALAVLLVFTAEDAERPAETEIPLAAELQRPLKFRSAFASGSAIETEEDAEDAAIAEIAPELSPTNPVARLIEAVDVGEWLGSCNPWQGSRPHWLVGVETDGMPDWFGTGHDDPAGFEGVYVVLDANEGVIVAFGALDGTLHSYDDISNITSQSLTISYETPLPAVTGAPTGQSPPSPTEVFATVEAFPTTEAACRAANW